MKQMIVFFTLAAVVAELHAAPQFITFKDGKLGVNFGGYHAAVGVGGGHGLMAEAGTPFGQQASAGLGGTVNGQTTGGLFAGATAGNGIKAQAGLGGTVNGQNTAGAGFASAQYGNRIATAGLGGEANESGATGVKYAITNVEEPSVVVQETTVEKVEKPVEEVSISEFVPLRSGFASNVNVNSNTNLETPVFTKEVHTEPATEYVSKRVYYKHKPHHNFYKTVSYVDAPIEKRIDNNVESSVNVQAIGDINKQTAAAGDVGFTKHVTVQRNPQFFADIFNIPISTLRAVSNFLGNSAANTNISVQKSASVSSDADISSKHAPKTSATSSETQFTVQTPPAGSFFDDIFAIPINTLGAVNKFLENNVPARKRIQVDGESSGAVRVGPGVRRRAAKRVILVQENKEKPTQKQE